MWVFLTDSFVSIVQDRTNPEVLIVRARCKGDIGRFMPDRRSVVKQTPDADYRFRTTATREEVGAALAKYAAGLRYDNFKAAVKSEARHSVYLDVWFRLKAWQSRMFPQPARMFPPRDICDAPPEPPDEPWPPLADW